MEREMRRTESYSIFAQHLVVTASVFVHSIESYCNITNPPEETTRCCTKLVFDVVEQRPYFKEIVTARVA